MIINGMACLDKLETGKNPATTCRSHFGGLALDELGEWDEG